MQTRHLLFVITIMLFLGSVYPLGKLATNNVPPILFSGLRVLVIFIAIFPFFKIKIPKGKLIIFLLLFSFSLGVGVYIFLYLAISSSTLLSPIIIGAQLAVPFGLILSSIFLKEKISIKKWLLIFFAFIGIVILFYDPRIRDEWLSLIYISLMALFYALSNILSRFLINIDTVSQIGWHSLVSIIPLFLISFIIEGNPIEILFPISTSTILIILHAALIASIIGHGGMFYLYKYYPVSKVLPFYSLFPIFGILLSFFIFVEVPKFFEIIGGSIVILSVYLINKENKKII